ncbi:MAG: tRNA epoxyqueuosine(34) reductase QueG [Sedimentisphaerales bacterium]
MQTIEDEIKQKAKSSGFDLIGITAAEPVDSANIEHFKKWLFAGCNGKMAWLANNIDKQFNPVLLLPEAKSVICTAINYKTLNQSKYIASYALYQDYHGFIKKKLLELAGFVKNKISKNLKFKICVDSAPLAERALAERAGLGFIGKNHLLTNPQFGSFLLLGELITNLPLIPDKPIQKKDFCKSCNACIDACPIGAISKNRFFDARECISYLTIEHKGRIPEELKSKINSHLFGCDRCILACPYNEKAPVCKNSDFKLSPDRQKISAHQILKFSQKDFDALFADSVISRAGLRQLKRNALICLKNVIIKQNKK